MDSLSEIENDKEYFAKFIEQMNKLKEKDELFDVDIMVRKNGSERIHRAHKVVLACASIYFKILILDLSKGAVLRLDLTTYESIDFPLILNYMYTGKIECSLQNVLCLYKFSKDFELNSLRSVVIRFMENNVTSDTWLRYWRFSYEVNNLELTEKCESFYKEKWEKILVKDLKKLKLKELSEVIKNAKINLENMHLKIFEYIIKWIQLEELERIYNLFELTGWNTHLLWDSISYLYDNQSRGFIDYLRNLSFSNMRYLCAEKTCESDKKILYICIREWINLTKKTETFLELLLLIDFKNMERKFVERQMSTERLIYENKEIKRYLESSTNSFHTEECKYSDLLDIIVKCEIKDQCIYLVSTDSIFKVDQRKRTLMHKISHKFDIGFSAIPTIDNKYVFMLSGTKLTKYSREENTLQQLAPMVEQRSLHNMIQFKDKIYSGGGSMDIFANTRTVEEYDMGTNKWRYAPSMNMGRYLYKMEEYCNTILVVGGKGEQVNKAPPMEQYDPRKGKWEIIPTSQFPFMSQYYFSFLCNNSVYYYDIDRAYGKKFDLKMNRWLDTKMSFPTGLNMTETLHLLNCCKAPIYVTAINKSNCVEVFEFDIEMEMWAKHPDFLINDFPQMYTSNLLGFLN